MTWLKISTCALIGGLALSAISPDAASAKPGQGHGHRPDPVGTVEVDVTDDAITTQELLTPRSR
jgi:hypothetical protein